MAAGVSEDVPLGSLDIEFEQIDMAVMILFHQRSNVRAGHFDSSWSIGLAKPSIAFDI